MEREKLDEKINKLLAEGLPKSRGKPQNDAGSRVHERRKCDGASKF